MSLWGVTPGIIHVGSFLLDFCFNPPRDALRTIKSHLKTSKSTIPPPNAIRLRARAMGQGYPLTGPSPGANPPINPSSLPLAVMNT
jgi:hypothetical protein